MSHKINDGLTPWARHRKKCRATEWNKACEIVAWMDKWHLRNDDALYLFNKVRVSRGLAPVSISVVSQYRSAATKIPSYIMDYIRSPAKPYDGDYFEWRLYRNIEWVGELAAELANEPWPYHKRP